MELKKYIRSIKDFPKDGILFRDISTLLKDPEAFSHSINLLSELSKDADVIVGPDARGFIFGTPVAYHLKKPFVMVRKPGKLPGELIREEYALEYGKNVLEIQKDIIKKGDRVIIVDDLMATGGTVNAMIKLLEKVGAIVIKVVVLMELEDLKGRETISPIKLESVIKY